MGHITFWFVLLMLMYWGSNEKAVAVAVTSKEVGLEINVKKSRYLVLSYQENQKNKYS